MIATRYGEQLFDAFATGWTGPFTGERGGTYWLSPSGKPSYDEPSDTDQSTTDVKPERKSLVDLAGEAKNPAKAAQVARDVEGRLPDLARGLADANAGTGDAQLHRGRAMALWSDSAKGLDQQTAQGVASQLAGIAAEKSAGGIGAKVKQFVGYLASLPLRAAKSVFQAIGRFAANTIKAGARVAGAVGLHLAGIAVGAAIAASPLLLPASIPFAVKLLAAIPLGWAGRKLITKVSTAAGNRLLDPQQRALRGHSESFADWQAEPTPTDQVALAGPDGRRAAELLGDAKRKGMLTLYYLTLRAMKRLLGKKRPASATKLFDESEMAALASSLAATTGTANLLGRSRIRERAEQAELVYQGVREFGENDSFLMFAEPPPPIPPERAIDYFNQLVPTLNVDPAFASIIRDRAFTMAVATDEALLGSVKNIISQTLTTGDTTGRVADIQDLLERAGVAPKNPQYSEMVYRTNMMNSYNEGATEELQDPLMQEFFPVWQWLGIRDGRQRHSHEIHFDKYYPSNVSFADVRDSEKGEYDGYNDRCTPRAVSKYEWRDLQAAGAKVEESW